MHVGLFGMVNGLAKQGQLTETEETFRRESNAWYNRTFTNPSDVMPDVYDRDLNPNATAWFKVSATHLIERATGYMDILSAHGVACERVESDAPGRVIYEDANQVVVVPF